MNRQGCCPRTNCTSANTARSFGSVETFCQRELSDPEIVGRSVSNLLRVISLFNAASLRQSDCSRTEFPAQWSASVKLMAWAFHQASRFESHWTGNGITSDIATLNPSLDISFTAERKIARAPHPTATKLDRGKPITSLKAKLSLLSSAANRWQWCVQRGLASYRTTLLCLRL
jgi:hypothetical protein